MNMYQLLCHKSINNNNNNPQEAFHHVMSLDKALKFMESRIETGEMKDVLKDSLPIQGHNKSGGTPGGQGRYC